MKKSLLALAIAGLAATPMAAQAGAHGTGVTFGGSAGFEIHQLKDQDINLELTKMRLNATAAQAAGDGTIIGRFEIDLDNNAHAHAGGATGDTEIKDARVTWKTAGAGTFVGVGYGPSSQHSSLVGMMDQFSTGGNNFWDQVSAAGNVLAWVPPLPITVVIGIVGDRQGLSTSDDVDATILRATWKGGPLTVSAGNVAYANDESRTGLNVKYDMGATSIALAYEDTQDDSGVANSEAQVTGLAVKFTSGPNTFKGAYTMADSKGGNNVTDGSTAIDFEWNYALSKKVNTFVTINQLNDEAGDGDAQAVGVNMSF